MNDIIYKVDVISSISAIEKWTLGISVFAAFTSLVLSIMVYCLSKNIGAQQINMQNYSFKIDLFDKRIDVFKAIAHVNSHALAVIFAIDNGFVVPQSYKLNIAKEVSEWEGILADNVIVTGFLFSKEIQNNILLIANQAQQTAEFFDTYITADNVSEITPKNTAQAFEMIKIIAEIFISTNVVNEMSNIIEL